MNTRTNGDRLRVLYFLDRLAGTVWFIPTVMALGGIGLALVSLLVDSQWDAPDGGWWGPLFQANANGAQAMLSTIAGSMITVAGVVFSVTVVTLTLASSQFGPRLLRGFITDNVNQTVLGTFIATFLFCLIILKASFRNEDTDFLPQISLLVSLGMATASIAGLIVFIHRITISIQASSIIARVVAEFETSIDRNTLEQPPAQMVSPNDETNAEANRMVAASRHGYLQHIDVCTVGDLAKLKKVHIELLVTIGSYVGKGMALFRVTGPDFSASSEAKLLTSLGFGNQRNPLQDMRCSVLQLVEIAVRSLSPGINDPFTAIACIDHMSGPLRVLAGRHFPSPHTSDDNGVILVTIPVDDWDGMIHACFDQIRQNASGKPVVMTQLLVALARIGDGAVDETRLSVLEVQAALIRDEAKRSIHVAQDSENVESAFDRVQLGFAQHKAALLAA